MQKTSFPFWAVVIDDCSSDKTALVLRDYERKYPSIIKAIYLEENYHSQKKSKSPLFEPFDKDAKYIAICEGDDYWTDPFKLQKQVDYLENNPEIGLCYTDYSRVDKDFHIISKACFLNGLRRPENFEEHLLTQSYIAPMGLSTGHSLWHLNSLKIARWVFLLKIQLSMSFILTVHVTRRTPKKDSFTSTVFLRSNCILRKSIPKRH